MAHVQQQGSGDEHWEAHIQVDKQPSDISAHAMSGMK
jgi:hypothetical protein